MDNQTTNILFNQIYHQTYKKALVYVTVKCGSPSDIADIMQEIYAELYSTMVRKGISYSQNPEAFVLQLAKTKVYRHYSLLERMNIHFPRREDEFGGENMLQEEALDSSSIHVVEDQAIDRILLKQIADYILTRPHDVQKIFYLYYALEQSTSQIAKTLNMKESTVKSKIHRTVHDVRKLYGKGADEDE